MTIEQGQHLRVLWQAMGFPDCCQPEVETLYYRTGDPKGLVVCLRCGNYLLGGLEDLMGPGEIG